MSVDRVDTARRRLLTGAVTVVGGVGSAFAAWPFVSSWQPSERARAIGAPVEVDISKLEPGGMITELWQGKPVWVVYRTNELLQSIPATDESVRDPASDEPQQPGYAKNEVRSIKPEYLVLVGVCTHLGCSPRFYKREDAHPLGPDWEGGFFCPCHGSKFDMAGRVYKGVPAPTNLQVPKHKYLSESVILVGEDGETA